MPSAKLRDTHYFGGNASANACRKCSKTSASGDAASKRTRYRIWHADQHRSKRDRDRRLEEKSEASGTGQPCEHIVKNNAVRKGIDCQSV